MPIDTFDLWTKYTAFVNTFQGGFTPPATVFMPAVNDISNEMWEEKTAIAENDNKVEDDLSPFIKVKNCTVSNTGKSFGSFLYPKNYGRFSSARLLIHDGKFCAEEGVEFHCKEEDDQEKFERVERYLDAIKEVEVVKISNSKWASCLTHLTKGPTTTKPKVTQVDYGFNVAPREVSVIVLSYFVRPTDATFAYTTPPGNIQTGSGDQIIYNKAGSIPLEWSSTLVNEFLWRLAVRFGLYTRDQFMAQMSASLKQ